MSPRHALWCAPSLVEASPAPALPAAVAFPWVLIAAIVTATVAAWLAVWTARRKSREEERARQRTLFAEAYGAYSAYKELPYAIRRRRADDPPGERVRLSEIAREIQIRLSYYEAWTAAESTAVGDAYRTLLAELREIAGGAMRDAWNDSPITSDREMNMPPTVIDLSKLAQAEKDFMKAVDDHLDRLAPWWPTAAERRAPADTAGAVGARGSPARLRWRPAKGAARRGEPDTESKLG
jgi:hypothetical protein